MTNLIMSSIHDINFNIYAIFIQYFFLVTPKVNINFLNLYSIKYLAITFNQNSMQYIYIYILLKNF